MTSLNISDSELVSRRNNIAKIFFQSRYNFLLKHNGLRPKKLHLFIGTPGGGKSTLRNSLLTDFLIYNPKKFVFIFLSEESVDDFKDDISMNPILAGFANRINILSEKDVYENYETPEEILDVLKIEILRSECSLLMFDNLTTSSIYSENFTTQSSFSRQFKSFLKDVDCTTILFAHTSSNVKQSNKLTTDQNDIRGSKSIVNLAEFLYIMQQFKEGNRVATTLRTVKHRGQEVDVKLFKLLFDSKTRTYKQDMEMGFEEFKMLLKKN